MAGLGGRPAPNAMPRLGAMTAAPGGPGPGEREPSAEEAGLFEEFLANVVGAVYTPETADGVAAMLTGPQPVEMLAQVVSGAVARVAYSAGENGLPVSGDMVTAAAAAVSEDLGREMARSVGAQPLSDDQVQAVFLRSCELLRDQRDEAMRAGEAERGGVGPMQGAATQSPPGAGGGAV